MFARKLPPLPESFRFGVASADHQCEAYDAQREDVRDLWERRRALTGRGVATDFWNRYAEDIALAKSLGCRAFRFSLAWSRLEPQPGVYDDAAFAHYRDVLGAIRAAGMEPVVTLHHYTWPLHVERRGGLIGDAFPGIFAAYGREVVRRIGAGVTYWITFNEPNQLVYGYVKPWWARSYFMPPGLCAGASTEEQMDAVRRLMHNLFVAHAAARDEIKAVLPEARVGTNPLLLGFPKWLQKAIDARATRVRSLRDMVRSGRRFTERALLEHGDVDVVLAQLTVTGPRGDKVAFSETYFVASLALLVAANSPIASPSALSGKALGVVRSTTADREAAELLPDADAVAFDTYDEALQELARGQIGALLDDDVLLRASAARSLGTYRVLADRLRDEPYGAAVARGNRELLDAVDASIRGFKRDGGWSASVARNLGLVDAVPPVSGRRATLADLHGFGESRPPEASTQRSRHVLEAIRRRGFLRVGVGTDAPGLCFRTSTGEYEGLEVDLARRIARDILGDESLVRFCPLRADDRLDSVRSLMRVFEPLLRAYGILFTLLSSDWWYLGMQGRLAEFLCPRSCVGALDFVGLDYYWGIGTLRLGHVGRLFDAAHQRYSLAPVQPDLLYDILAAHAEAFPSKEIVVVENGCVDEADGVTRERYLRSHVQQVQRAVAAGIPVSMYLCWSITSNREWGAPFGKDSDFGLFHIDLDRDAGLQRISTPAAATYRDIIGYRGT